MGIATQNHLAALFAGNLPEVGARIVAGGPKSQQVDFQGDTKVLGVAAKFADMPVIDGLTAGEIIDVGVSKVRDDTGVHCFPLETAVVVQVLCFAAGLIHTGNIGDTEKGRSIKVIKMLLP